MRFFCAFAFIVFFSTPCCSTEQSTELLPEFRYLKVSKIQENKDIFEGSNLSFSMFIKFSSVCSVTTEKIDENGKKIIKEFDPASLYEDNLFQYTFNHECPYDIFLLKINGNFVRMFFEKNYSHYALWEIKNNIVKNKNSDKEVFQEIFTRYKTPLGSKIERIKKDMQEADKNAHEAISSVCARGEKIETVLDSTKNLQYRARRFQHETKKLKKKWWQRFLCL